MYTSTVLDSFKEEMESCVENHSDLSYEAIEASKETTFERFVIALDIPEIGNHASKILAKTFKGSLKELEYAFSVKFDFTQLQDFGETLNNNIHNWFSNKDNVELFNQLKAILKVPERAVAKNSVAENFFASKKIVFTGTLSAMSRPEAEALVESFGASTSKSVSKKTDIVVYGDDADGNSKFEKAKSLGVTTMTDSEFMSKLDKINGQKS